MQALRSSSTVARRAVASATGSLPRISTTWMSGRSDIGIAIPIEPGAAASAAGHSVYKTTLISARRAAESGLSTPDSMQHTQYCGAAFSLLPAFSDPISATEVTLRIGCRGFPMMFLSRLLRLMSTWQKYNSSVRQLSNLDDRELADIGIARSQIRARAWDAAHR